MLHRNESDFRGSTSPKAKSHRTRSILRFLCGVIVVITLPFSAGCSPELMVGGAILGSVLYAHANKDGFPPTRGRVGPTTYRGGAYTDSGGPSRTYVASNPPVQKAGSQAPSQAGPTSPIMEGAQAYRELRWDDAVRVLGRAINTGNCTESELGQAHILMGAIAYQQGDAEAARRHFVQAHRYDPQLHPAPELFPPQLIDFYKDVSGP